jgi:inhibitor of cysteine peptidase
MNRNNSDSFRHFFKLSLKKVASNTKKIQTGAIIILVLMFGVVVIPGNPMMGETMKLNENDSGKTVEILVGDELEVILPSNPTTGYTWDLILLDTNVLRPEKEEFFAINKAIGSGGVEVIKFRAIAAGKSTVKLIFHRPFEHNVPPLNTFEVTVIIKKALSD